VKRERRPTPATLDEFYALEAAVWKEITAAWRGLPAKRLVRPGASGPAWSVKDVMNHLAAWMMATQAALPGILARRPLPKGEYDIASFNERHAAADQARSLAASRRRLNRARRAFLDYVATLPPADVLNVKARPGRWIKFATYGHYDEHLAALTAFARRAND